MNGRKSSRVSLWAAAILACASAVGLVSVAAGTMQEPAFPHAAHRGMFPVCTGCHAPQSPGAAPGFPAPESCASCHDGVDLSTVSWSGPSEIATNLRFDHVAHAADVAASGRPDPSSTSARTPA